MISLTLSGRVEIRKHVSYHKEKIPFSMKPTENSTKKLQQESTVEEENGSEKQSLSLEGITDNETESLEQELCVSQHNAEEMNPD